jgi:putative membrane protein
MCKVSLAIHHSLTTFNTNKHMKNIIHFKTTILQAGIIVAVILGILSFSPRQEPNDNINVGKTQNERSVATFSREKDAQFLVKAAEINLEEVKLGQLAQQKSMVNDVKELGQMMEKDHSQSLNDLTILAKKKSMTIPTIPSQDAQAAYENLIKKSESTFDKDYCNMMVSGHRGAIAMFEKESKESSDADIRQWAIETLPHLRMHLEHAIACQKKCERM